MCTEATSGELAEPLVVRYETRPKYGNTLEHVRLIPTVLQSRFAQQREPGTSPLDGSESLLYVIPVTLLRERLSVSLYTHNVTTVLPDGFPRQGLSHVICTLVLGPDVRNHNLSCLNVTPNKVVPDTNVLGLCRPKRIVG